jgi:hypothetical protein
MELTGSSRYFAAAQMFITGVVPGKRARLPVDQAVRAGNDDKRRKNGEKSDILIQGKDGGDSRWFILWHAHPRGLPGVCARVCVCVCARHHRKIQACRACLVCMFEDTIPCARSDVADPVGRVDGGAPVGSEDVGPARGDLG